MRDFAHVRILNVKRHPLGVILGAVARALIGGGGGGVYLYIRVTPDGFLLKLT